MKLAAAVDTAPEPVRDAVAGARVADLPRDIGTEVRDRAAKELARLAGELDPGALAHVGRRILQVVAPDAADRLALERAEARARECRAFTMTPDPSGFGVRVSGRLTNEDAAVVRAAIDALCKPAPCTDPRPSAARTRSSTCAGWR